MPWPAVRYSHLAAVRSVWVTAAYAPSTINSRLSAVRGAMQECWRLGQIDSEALARIRDVPNARGSRKPAGRALDAGDMRALFAACEDGTPSGARDTALLALAYGTGARRSELAGVQLSDWNIDGAQISVIGKGNKQRSLYLSRAVDSAVRAWLDMRGPHGGALLHPVSKSGRINRRSGLSGTAIDAIVKRRARLAGIGRVSPHDLRRSHCSDALDAGADIASVARLMGHASVQTTMRYDRRPDRAARRAAELIHVPVRMSQMRLEV